MLIKGLRLFCLLLAAALASCAGGQNLTLPFARSTTPTAGETNKKSSATLTILIPSIGTNSKPRGRRHRYVSPATQSVAITVNSTAGTAKTLVANLTPVRNKNCKASLGGVKCVLTLSLAPGHYTAEISTYDGPVVHGQPTGAELSANQDVPFRLRPNKVTAIQFSLGGIPASVAFLPGATSQLTGNLASGYTLPRCQPTAQPVSVFGVDSDGNIIVGAGAPSVTVRAGSTGLAVAAPKPATPSLFMLSPPAPPTYPSIGSTVYIEILVNPRVTTAAKPVFAIVKVTFTTDICGVFTEFPIPTANSQPWGIAAGSDGALWFTEKSADKIARIPTTATASKPNITEFPVPTASAAPFGIASDSNGYMWFTESKAAQVGRMAASGPPIQEFSLSRPSQPMSIAAGPDGAMWFADWCANAIERVTTSGVFTVQKFALPTTNAGPSGITLGTDGAFWFTETVANKVGRIPISGAPISESTIGTARSQPISIASAPDGELWFSETCGGSTCNGNFGKVAATAGSPVQEIAPPVPSTTLWGVAAGPDGAMWYAQLYNDILYRVTTGGVVSSFALPNAGSGPLYVTTGPDGNIWFTEEFSNKIGRLQ